MTDLAPWRSPRATANEPVGIVVGTMNFGKRTDEAEARRIVDRALERGVTHFDTANAYVSGLGEQILGRALGTRRSEAVLATKVGLLEIGGSEEGLLQAGGAPEGLGKERIIAACHESLRRLGTDVIDVYYLHVPDGATPIRESLEGMAALIGAGKIRSFALSNYASWQVLEMFHLCEEMGIDRPLMAQQMENLLVRQLDIEYFQFAERYRFPTAVYNPLAGGMLSDRRIPPTPVTGSRLDGNPMYQARYGSDVMRQRVLDYQKLAREVGLSLVDLAYAWLASRSEVDSIVVGPATVAHLDAALDACERRLDTELMAKLDGLYRAHVGTDAVYARL